MEEQIEVAEKHLKLAFSAFDAMANDLKDSKQTALVEDSLNKIAEVIFNLSELQTKA